MQPVGSKFTRWLWFTERIDAALKDYEVSPDKTRKTIVGFKMEVLQVALPVDQRKCVGEALEAFNKSNEASAKEACQSLRDRIKVITQQPILNRCGLETDRINAVQAATLDNADIPRLAKDFDLNPGIEGMQDLAAAHFKDEAFQKEINNKNEAERFKSASLLADRFGHHMWCQVAAFNLTEVHRLNIIEKVISSSRIWSIENFRSFAIPNEADRSRLAMKFKDAPCELLAKNVMHFNLSENSRFEFAKKILICTVRHPHLGTKDLDLKQFRFSNVNYVLELLERALHPPNKMARLCRETQEGIPDAHVSCSVAPEFADLRKEVGAIIDPKSKRESTQLLGYLNWVYRKKSAEERRAAAPLAAEILSIQNPELRYNLVDTLFANGVPQIPAATPKRAHLFHLMLAPLKKVLPTSEWEMIFKNLESLTYKDAIKVQTVLTALHQIVTSELSVDDQRTLLKNIFGGSSILPPHSALRLVSVLFNAYLTKLLQSKLGSNSTETDVKEGADRLHLTDLLRSVADKLLGIDPSPDFQRKYEATFGKARFEHGILILAARIHSSFEVKNSKPALTKVVTAILEDKYLEMRYAMAPGSHLGRVFKGREDLQKTWRAGEVIRLQTLDHGLKVPEAASSDLQGILVKLTKLDTTLTNLSKCLDNPAERPGVLAEMGKMAAEIAGKTKDDEKFIRKLNELKLEMELIKLIDAKNAETKCAIIRKVIPFLETRYGDKSEQVNIFRGLLATEAPIVYTVEDTDHWEDMLLIGERLHNSCLLLDREYFEYILGCMADGKTRAMVIKEGGNIVARCLLTILLTIDGKPVLVQQPVLTVPNPHPKMREIVNEMCKRRARALGLPLVWVKEEENWPKKRVPYYENLFSLSCPVPFESFGAMKSNGKYTVESQYLYTIDTTDK